MLTEIAVLINVKLINGTCPNKANKVYGVENKPDRIESLLARKRLASLNLRLKRLAGAWTVDNYQSFLKFYVAILPKLMEAERCTIYIIEMGTDKICSMYGTGLEDRQIEPPREGSVVGKVISTGRGLIENDLQQQKGFHTRMASETHFVTRNMVCAPIRSVTSPAFSGAIQILNKKQGDFTAADLVLLEEVAGYLSTSIESIILNQEIFRISGQLNREVERFDEGYFLDTLFIAESPAMREVVGLARMVSATPVNVLILGENGTGKELVARLIHEGSDRREQPFVAVNCASIPDNLMESEFFGYDKGAFSGADHSRKGRFEEADGGTLMLDEIADMPLTIQPKFLRAIQEGEGSRLGSNKLYRYDLRIISATNKDLRKEVEAGRFREDLFFRIFSVELRVPPLRDRKEDIALLAGAFLEQISRRFKKKMAGFSPRVLNLFEDYSWPGNVRQLRSEVERLVALTPEGQEILPDKCSRELRGTSALALAGIPGSESLVNTFSIPDQVKALEIRLIRKALKKTNGNRLKAAELLDITRQGLHKKLKRYLLDVTEI